MRPHVPNEHLTAAAVPSDDAPLADVVVFAHSFHAYKVAGSVERVAGIAARAHATWTTDGTVPDDLTTLRVVLFATVRAQAHDTGATDESWLRALTAAIRGCVAGS